MNIHTTAKGTELPILNLRGKDYLEVKYRIVWFREEHPTWSIETEFVSMTDKSATAKATIKDEAGRVITTSHKSENTAGFPDFLEKAETGAIGRALALIGYGTQFCADELDEGDRIVDAPVQKQGNGAIKAKDAVPANVGDFVITFGKKYNGKRLRDIPLDETEGFVRWCEETAAKQGKPVSPEVVLLRSALEAYRPIAELHEDSY